MAWTLRLPTEKQHWFNPVRATNSLVSKIYILTPLHSFQWFQQLIFKKWSYFLSSYIPVLMAQAKIYWDMDNYTQVEKVPINTSIATHDCPSFNRCSDAV